MKKIDYLSLNKIIIQDQSILDLACHDGESTKLIQSLGAKHIYAVDIRQHLIDKAKKELKGNVDFFVHDITDYDFISSLVGKSQSVICLGVFYHLFDHFRFLSKILCPNVNYVLIESVCGPETINPEMYWGFEPTIEDTNGWLEGVTVIPNGTPNLSWIVQSANIFGFELDWIHYYGASELKKFYNITIEEYTSIAGPDWPQYSDIISNKNIPEFVVQELNQMLREFPCKHRRMILRLFNSNTISSKPLDVQNCFAWPY